MSKETTLNVEEGLAPTAHGNQCEPSLPPNHPVNAIGRWRKVAILATLSYASFVANFSIPIILIGMEEIAETFEVSPAAIAPTVGYMLLGIAFGPLIWNPLSKTIGRRPVYLVGSFLFIPMLVWNACSKSINVFIASRVVAGIACSFTQTVPPATIADIFPRDVRGSKMAVFAVTSLSASLLAPFFSGIIIRDQKWPVLFWVCTAMAGLSFILFVFIVPETLWVADPVIEHSVADVDIKGHVEVTESSDRAEKPTPLYTNGHVGSAWMPWSRPGQFVKEFLLPIRMLGYVTMLLPSFFYCVAYAAGVGMTITIPLLLAQPPYNFGPIARGASILAMVIGGWFGLYTGGAVGDKVVLWKTRKAGQRRPEYRLWAAIPNIPVLFIGSILVAIGMHYPNLHWMLMLVGSALYQYAFTALTGIFQTYLVEIYLTRSMDSSAVLIFFRSMGGFAITYFVLEWGEKQGWLLEYIIQGIIVATFGSITIFVILAFGQRLRVAQNMPKSH